jgi:hypothetical protein
VRCGGQHPKRTYSSSVLVGTPPPKKRQWESKTTSPSKMPVGTEFQILAVFTYKFMAGRKEQMRLQVVALVYDPNTGEISPTVIVAVAGPLADPSTWPTIGAVYSVTNVFPRLDTGTACLSVRLVFSNPTRAPTRFLAIPNSKVVFPQNTDLQVPGLTLA